MATAPRKMILNRNHTMTSLFGHSILFKKGEPTDVPRICYAEALALGAEFADGEGIPAPEEKTGGAPSDPLERQAQILAAVQAIVERNASVDFTAAGSPKVAAVEKALGYDVTSKEVAVAWQAHHDAKAAARLEEQAGN